MHRTTLKNEALMPALQRSWCNSNDTKQHKTPPVVVAVKHRELKTSYRIRELRPYSIAFTSY